MLGYYEISTAYYLKTNIQAKKWSTIFFPKTFLFNIFWSNLEETKQSS